MKAEELFVRARNALAVGDLSLAERFARQLQEARPDDPAVHVLLGNVYAKTGADNNAIRAYQRAIELDSRNAEAHNNSGVIYKRVGNIPAAVRAFQTAYELAPDRPDVAYNLGNIYKKSGDRKLAEEFYRRAIERDRTFALAYNNLGSMYEEAGDHTAAVETYRKGLEKDPNNPTLRYNLGVSLEAVGTPERALAEFQHALRARPGWVEGLNNLGVVLDRLDKSDRAVRIFDEILKQNPANAKVRNNLGHALARQGRREDAEAHFMRALEEDPAYGRAALNLAQLRQDGGNLEGALEALTSLESHAAGVETEVPLRKAQVLTEMGRLREADGEIKKVLTKEPRNPRAHVVRGNLLRRAGKAEAALASYHRAVEIDPRLTEARMNGAIVLREAGRLADAAAEVGRILDGAPEAFEPRLLLAQLCSDRGDLDSATSMLEQLRSERPRDDVVARDLIDVYKRSGKSGRAMEAANDLVNLHGRAESASDIDRLSESLELYEEAARNLTAENEELIARNLRALSEEPWEEEGLEGESVLYGELPSIADEEAAIIDVGGIEPIIAVNEEEEHINLREMEEEWEPIPETPKEEREPALAAPPAAGMPLPGGAGSGAPGKGGRGAREADRGGGAAAEGASPDGLPWPAGAGRREPLSFTGSLRVELVQPLPQPAEEGRAGRERPEEAEAAAEGGGEAAPEAGTAEIAKKPEGSPARVEGGKDGPAGLFSYLDHLTRFLPEAQRSIFDGSDMHLRLEALEQRLRGRPGLRSAAELRSEEAAAATVTAPTAGRITPDRLTETFSFMNRLAEFHPDQEVSLALKYKIAHILQKLRGH